MGPRDGRLTFFPQSIGVTKVFQGSFMFCGWSPCFGCVWGSCLACEAIGQLKKIIVLLWWSLLFHLLTISRKRKVVFKAGFVLIVPPVLSPPYHQLIPLWCVSSVPTFCQRTAWSLIDFISFFQHVLVSPNLYDKKSCSKYARTTSHIYLILSTHKKHLPKRWSMRVCLFIGNPLASLNLVTLKNLFKQENCIVIIPKQKMAFQNKTRLKELSIVSQKNYYCPKYFGGKLCWLF